MGAFLEAVFYIVFYVWLVRFVWRQSWAIGYKAFVIFLGASLCYAIWNRPLAGQWGMSGHGPLVAFFAGVGVVVLGNWLHGLFGRDWRSGTAITVIAIGIILIIGYPYYVAGPASIMPTMPSVPTAPSAAAPPTPPPHSSGTSRSRPERAPDDDDCAGYSTEMRARLGCP